MEKLSEVLAEIVGEKRAFLTITGGGGKTTLLNVLGRGYARKGFSVLLTTTTKFQSPACYAWDVEESGTEEEDLHPEKGKVALFGKPFNEEKWSSPSFASLSAVSEAFDVVITEGDGSRHRPLKFHTERDPVIHPESQMTIAVLGGWCLGKTASEVAFGDYGEERVVDDAFLKDYLASPGGLLKGNVKLIVVNGFDTLSKAQQETYLNLDWKGIPVLLGNIEKDELIRTVNR